MTIGEKMKFRRKELKISADEIAKTLGVSRSTIFRYEKGEIEKLPTENLRKIAEVLKTTPEELMGWTKTENNFPIISIYNQLSPPRQQKVYDFANQELQEQKQEQAKDDKKSVIPIENNKKDSDEIYTFAANSDDPDKTYTDKEISEIEAFLDQIKADYDKKHNK